MKATLRDELHIRLWIAPNRTAESREIAALPAVDDALPCAQTLSVHMGARQLIVTDIEDRWNINKERHLLRKGRFLPCADPIGLVIAGPARQKILEGLKGLEGTEPFGRLPGVAGGRERDVRLVSWHCLVRRGKMGVRPGDPPRPGWCHGSGAHVR